MVVLGSGKVELAGTLVVKDSVGLTSAMVGRKVSGTGRRFGTKVSIVGRKGARVRSACEARGSSMGRSVCSNRR